MATHLIQTSKGAGDENIGNNFVRCFVGVSNADSYSEGEHKMYIPKNKELRKISGSKMGVVSEQTGILHIQKFNYLYMSPSTLKLATSSRLWWVEHVAMMGRQEMQIVFYQKTSLETATWKNDRP